MLLFDAEFTGGLSLDPLQPWGKAGMGFFKEKVHVLYGIEGRVSLLFWAVASGFQDVSRDG